MAMSNVEVGSAGGDVQILLPVAMPAYLAIPAGQGPWPGVVVLSDILGMTTDLRRQAEWRASAGLLAVAPDLFFRGNKLVCLRTIFRDALKGAGARSTTSMRPGVAGRAG